MSKVAVVILISLGCLAGVVLSAIRLPGIWLIAGGGLLLGWMTHWELISVNALWWMIGLSVLAEVLEFVMSGLVTRRAGGSRKAALGALIGGFLGLLFFSISLPVIGSIIGALLGCFLGAAVGELSVRGSLAHGTRVGISAALGFALGAAVKVALAFIISIIAVSSAVTSNWPSGVAVQAGSDTAP